MYDYIPDKELRNALRVYCEEAILALQNELKDYFTFSFKLIGSGDTRLMMINGKDNSIDLDYNLVIQRDKRQLIGDPGRIKHLFMKELKDYFGKDVKVSDSTQVITCNVGKMCGYKFSFDIAIIVDGNDGYMYKIVNDKNTTPTRYIWNKIPKSKDYEYKFTALKRMGYWEDIKKLYKAKKNNYLKRQSDIASFSILIETVNEIIQKNHIEL